MPPELPIPHDFLAEVTEAERESVEAVARQYEPAIVDGVVAKIQQEANDRMPSHDPGIARRPGRPPKGKCTDCGKPLARGRVCPCVTERLAQQTASRPAWEPLPIEDLRVRLDLLIQADVESYEDGPIKIQRNASSRGMRVVRGERTQADGSKW